MHVKTSGIGGFLLVRSLAWLKRWRPHSLRYAEEQALIERWLAAVRAAAPRDTSLALEIAACAGLLKGYGETHRRGRANFLAILDALVENPAADDAAARAAAIRNARVAALSDPEQKALEKTLGRPVTWLHAAKTR
jgi:indolepyruvate ferredoxin oxidoreductase beta subunit